MALVDWKDEFKIGIDEVDFEHHEMIDLINESFSEAKRSGSSEALLDFLGEIFEKISAHFALEEKVMCARHYEDFASHKDDHERLLDSIRDLMDDFIIGGSLDEAHFGEHLKNWFVSHFSTHDAQLHKLMSK